MLEDQLCLGLVDADCSLTHTRYDGGEGVIDVNALEERKIEGRWWVFGNKGPSHFGTLTSSQKTLELTVKIPQDLTVEQTVLQAADAPEAVPNVIVGRNAYNQPITLFGCFCLPQMSEGLTTLRIHAIAAINGLEVAGWSEPAIRAVSIEIDPVSIWLGGQAVIQKNVRSGINAFSLPAPTDLSFEVSDGVELRIWCSTSQSFRQEKVEFTQESSVWLQFRELRSLQDISDNWIPWVTRLFSLLLGIGVWPKSRTCYEEKFFGDDAKPLGKKGELLREGAKARTEASAIGLWQMVTRYPEIAADLAKIIAKWGQVAEKYEEFVDLFSSVVFSQSLHTEAQFLFLVQALEVYHARCPAFDSMKFPPDAHKERVKRAVTAIPNDLKEWARLTLQAANYKHLDTRLSETFARYSKESAKILGTDPALPEKIRYTRNHLTHHTGSDASMKLLKGSELVQVTWDLRTFIWACILKEMGLSGAPIDRLIEKYDAQFVTLG